MQVGNLEIRRIEELTFELRSEVLPDWQKGMARDHEWLDARFYVPEKDRFKVSIHSWLVKTPEHRILIDTCAGNCKQRPAYKALNDLHTPYLARLEETGVSPNEIDFVICTHLHVDHVGWNTQLAGNKWIPTFPRAVYVLSRKEREARDPAFGVAAPGSNDHQIYIDSILPIIEADQAWLVEGDETVVPGIDLVPTPGHSPGHIAVRAHSGGEEVMFSGDITHHPLQIYHPGWNTNLCEDPALARETRQRILEHCARQHSLYAPAHFPRPHCGYVSQTGTGFSFLPTEDLF